MINIHKLILILSFLQCYMSEPQLKLLNVVSYSNSCNVVKQEDCNL